MKFYCVTITKGTEKYILIDSLLYDEAYSYCKDHEWTFTDGYGDIYALDIEEEK